MKFKKMKPYEKHYLKEQIKSWLVIIFIIFVVGMALSRPFRYDNGECLKCGGHYEVIEKSFLDGTSYVTVKCDKCGDTIYMLPTFYLS